MVDIYIYFTGDGDTTGYHKHDFFRGGAATVEKAKEASSVEEADRILREAYLGPDVEGIGVEWSIATDA